MNLIGSAVKEIDVIRQNFLWGDTVLIDLTDNSGTFFQRLVTIIGQKQNFMDTAGKNQKIAL